MTSYIFKGTLGCIHNRGTAAIASARKIFDNELEGIREAGTWKAERVITSPQDSVIKVKGQTSQILNFCANNYLGLSVSIKLLEIAPRKKRNK